jgi:hypothetical protein
MIETSAIRTMIIENRSTEQGRWRRLDAGPDSHDESLNAEREPGRPRPGSV